MSAFQKGVKFIIPFFFLILAHGIGLCAEGSTDYHFDSNGISRTVLENYLKRSVTAESSIADSVLPNKEDDYRLIRNIGAKFIGRAIFRWGSEDTLNNPRFLEEAKRIVAQFHKEDPDIVFQACLFEAVTQKVNNVKIPSRSFEILGLPPEDRNFRYNDIIHPGGIHVNLWGEGASVPDISRSETKLWFIFLADFYMEAGCDAFHLGQVNLMGMNDPELKHWEELVGHIRKLAQTKTRRGWIILDAHTPYGGLVVNGKSLLDFNSFPLRVKEIVEKPMEGVLEVGYLDSLYKRSKGCITPSGWKCDSLPYLVEFDNFGVSTTPGEATVNSHFIWGYDEITWFYLQSEEYRNAWLKYARDWVRKNDSNGFLQMPVGRVVTPGKGEPHTRFRANPPSDVIPNGKNLEDAIKKLWQ